MKVSFSGNINNISKLYTWSENITPKKTSVPEQIEDLPISFLGLDLVKPYSPKDDLYPITGKREYKFLLDKIKNERTLFLDLPYWSSYVNERKYKDIPEELMGLTIYAGFGDKSDDINKYLSGRINYEKQREDAIIECMNKSVPIIGAAIPKHKSTYPDMVRVLDYSLENLDAEYGKYSGIVYRTGYMDCNTPQFFSSSISAEIVTKLNSNSNQYSIIRTKSGHKIADFQKAFDVSFAENEQEILLDRKAKYRIVPPDEYDEELLAAKNKLENLLKEKGCFSEVQVFEEI